MPFKNLLLYFTSGWVVYKIINNKYKYCSGFENWKVLIEANLYYFFLLSEFFNKINILLILLIKIWL